MNGSMESKRVYLRHNLELGDLLDMEARAREMWHSLGDWLKQLNEGLCILLRGSSVQVGSSHFSSC